MTVYECPICGKPHDSAMDVPCIQTYTLPTLPANPEPVSADMSLPAWERSYFCPQCPRFRQPPSGFRLPDFLEHVNLHSDMYLRDAIDVARRTSCALKELEHVVVDEQSAKWPTRSLLFRLELIVLQGLYWNDEAKLAAWRDNYDRRAAELNALAETEKEKKP